MCVVYFCRLLCVRVLFRCVWFLDFDMCVVCVVLFCVVPFRGVLFCFLFFSFRFVVFAFVVLLGLVFALMFGSVSVCVVLCFVVFRCGWESLIRCCCCCVLLCVGV